MAVRTPLHSSIALPVAGCWPFLRARRGWLFRHVAHLQAWFRRLSQRVEGDGVSRLTHPRRDRPAAELALLQERHHDLDHSAERRRRGVRPALREVHRYIELILIQGRSPGWPNQIRNSKPRLPR